MKQEQSVKLTQGYAPFLLSCEAIESLCGVQLGDALIVGVSGGADSLCLLLTLHGLGYDVTGVIVDHMLRPESGAERDWVQQVCAEHGIPLLVFACDVGKIAAEQSLSIEEAGRNARYERLIRVAQEQQASAVAVGHHADDQVETILMHLIRGAGLQGLAGMAPTGYFSLDGESGSQLIRPFLNLRRRDIEDWMNERGIPFLTDSSNMDPTFTRNRVRHELIPLLETFNPQAVSALLRLSDLAACDLSFLDGVTDAAVKAVGSLEDENQTFRMKRSENKRYHSDAILTRVIRYGAEAIHIPREKIDYPGIRRAADFFTKSLLNDEIVAMDWVDGVTLYRMRNEIGMTRLKSGYRNAMTVTAPQLPESFTGDAIRFEIPGKIPLASGWIQVHRAEIRSPEEKETMVREMQSDAHVTYLAEAAVCGSLTLRAAKVGERFEPFGMGGKTQLLSDFWINNKVHLSDRGRYPLVVDDAGVLWIVGRRASWRAMITGETSSALRLEWVVDAAREKADA